MSLFCVCFFHRSIEAAAGHEAARTEQIARGQLDRQKLSNEQSAERERAKLYELQVRMTEKRGKGVVEG